MFFGSARGVLGHVEECLRCRAFYGSILGSVRCRRRGPRAQVRQLGSIAKSAAPVLMLYGGTVLVYAWSGRGSQSTRGAESSDSRRQRGSTINTTRKATVAYPTVKRLLFHIMSYLTLYTFKSS